MSTIQNEIKLIDPREILLEVGFNTRYKDELNELKPLIKASGVIEPLHVRSDDKGNIILGAQGHRRLACVLDLLEEGVSKAANGVKLTEIPVRFEGEKMTDEDRKLLIVTGNSGKPLEMLEEALVYRDLRDKAPEGEGDATLKAVAVKAGRSIVFVRNLVALTEQSKTTLGKIRADKISATTVVELMVGTRAEYEKIDKETLAEKVEARVLKAIARAENSGKAKATAKDTKEDKPEVDKATAKAQAEAEAQAKARREEEKQELRRLKKIEGNLGKVVAFVAAKREKDLSSAVTIEILDLLDSALAFIGGVEDAKLSVLSENMKGIEDANKEAIKEAIKLAKEGKPAKA